MKNQKETAEKIMENQAQDKPKTQQEKPKRRFRVNHEVGPRVYALRDTETRTKQAFRDDCDINNIMRRYEKTGVLPDIIKTNPQYGDFSEASDYQTALNTVMKAQEQFSALPSKVRERFANDPENFLAFVSDASNKEEMAKMGLLAPAAAAAILAPKKSDPSESTPKGSKGEKTPKGED